MGFNIYAETEFFAEVSIVIMYFIIEMEDIAQGDLPR